MQHNLCHKFVLCADFRAVGSPLVMDPNVICRKSRKLGGKQYEICQNEPEIVEEAAKGVEMAIAECQFQFRHRRWNCTTANRSITKVLKSGEYNCTLRGAFVHRPIISLATVSVLFSPLNYCINHTLSGDMKQSHRTALLKVNLPAAVCFNKHKCLVYHLA